MTELIKPSEKLRHTFQQMEEDGLIIRAISGGQDGYMITEKGRAKLRGKK